jgi:hypothetical protein
MEGGFFFFTGKALGLFFLKFQEFQALEMAVIRV